MPYEAYVFLHGNKGFMRQRRGGGKGGWMWEKKKMKKERSKLKEQKDE